MNENIQQQLALAQQYARAGAYAAAQMALRKIIDKARANAGAWLLLGQVYGLQNAHADAEQAFAQAARLDPRSPDAHAYLGVVCYGLRDFDAAIAHSRQALAIKPDCAVSYYNIGNAQKEQGKHDEAIASFDQAQLGSAAGQCRPGRSDRRHAATIRRNRGGAGR